MTIESCGSFTNTIIRQHLVALYLIWVAATAIAIFFVIIPGYDTLSHFQITQCRTTSIKHRGENPCTYCLQIFVKTTNTTDNVSRQLQKDELAIDTWCTFRSSCDMGKKGAKQYMRSMMKEYGINSSEYRCFVTKSNTLSLAVLSINKYPERLILKLIIWLTIGFFILITCTMNACRRTRRKRSIINATYNDKREISKKVFEKTEKRGKETMDDQLII